MPTFEIKRPNGTTDIVTAPDAEALARDLLGEGSTITELDDSMIQEMEAAAALRNEEAAEDSWETVASDGDA